MKFLLDVSQESGEKLVTGYPLKPIFLFSYVYFTHQSSRPRHNIGGVVVSEQDYNYKVIRQFSIMTVVWGLVGMLVGVPIAMQIPKERGFLFASALVAVGLVMCAALLGATVMLWEMGAMPVFTD